MKRLLIILLPLIPFFISAQNYVRVAHGNTVYLVNITGADSVALPTYNQTGFKLWGIVDTVTLNLLALKQASLVSGTNIKTINSSSILGSGDLVVGGADPTKLAILNNLSDLNNAATARSNLGLGNVTNESKATMFSNATFTGTFAVPAGSIANASLVTSPVTAIGVTTANGVSGSSSGGATPNLTITLGAITPTTIVATDMISTPAGTTSITPLKVTNGVLATTSIAGGIENDGITGYMSTVAGDRGVVPSIKFVSSTATFAVPNSAAAFPIFATTEDAFNVVASTSYFFEAMYEITGMGATTRTTGTLFGGTATITSIRYYAMIQTGAANALSTAQSTKSCVTATSNILNATATTAAEIIHIKGIVRVNGAGTFIPQAIHSADPTGTIVVAVNSWFRMYPIGTNTVIKSGNIN